MSTRRDFLKIFGGTLAAASGATLLSSCAGQVNYRAQVADDKIVIPKTEAQALAKSNGVMLTNAPGVGRVLLKNVDGKEIVALALTCTHRGCEVQPLPDGFECPCHGSEYDGLGNVIEGPARLPLTRFKVEETAEAFIVNTK
jgi:Rieske Fe-S protein